MPHKHHKQQPSKEEILELLHRHGIRAKGNESLDELLTLLEDHGFRNDGRILILETIFDVLLLLELYGICFRPEPPRDCFTIRITQEKPMTKGFITAGGTSQFGAQLLRNGSPDTTDFKPSFTFTTSDPRATVAPATTDASGGTIPLEAQAVISVPADDTLGSIVVTASVTDPNGATQASSLTISIGAAAPPADVFSVGLQQLA